jgi:hypothetical protein
MTRVSGTNIIRTPCCAAELSTPAYSSLNFMAWEYWTDGYADASLAPGGEGLRRCICGRCFLLAMAQRVKTIPTPKPPAPIGWESRRDNWWSRLLGRESRAQILENYDTRLASDIETEQRSMPPSPEYVRDSELLALIDSGVADDGVMETARRLYWRHLNEPFREIYRAFRESHKGEVDAVGESATFPEYLASSEQTWNMEQLVKLIEGSANPNWLELAELHREMGDMNAASRALGHIAGEQQRLHYVVEKLVALKVRCPVRFNY